MKKKFYRVAKYVLLFSIVLLCGSPARAAGPWQTAYANELKTPGTATHFALVNLGDGAPPELLLFADASNRGYLAYLRGIYTYTSYSDSLTFTDEFYEDYYVSSDPLRPGIFACWISANGRSGFTDFLYLEDGLVKKIAVCSYFLGSFGEDSEYIVSDESLNDLYENSVRITLHQINADNITQYILNDSSDMPSNWAAELVNAAIREGLVPLPLQMGYLQSTTRIEFCALAVAVYENQKGEITGRVQFSDTSDINAEKAAAVGIVTGVGDNKFAPNAEMTREQAAVMLSRLADAVGKPLPRRASEFSDSGDVASWAIEQVGHVQAAGIMGGVGDNRFAPLDPYTREQSISTIMRLYTLVN